MLPEPQREVHIKDGPGASIPERPVEDQLRKTSQIPFSALLAWRFGSWHPSPLASYCVHIPSAHGTLSQF
jgi:hypothetical protein